MPPWVMANDCSRTIHVELIAAMWEAVRRGARCKRLEETRINTNR